jgi:hypothetical protein
MTWTRAIAGGVASIGQVGNSGGRSPFCASKSPLLCSSGGCYVTLAKHGTDPKAIVLLIGRQMMDFVLAIDTAVHHRTVLSKWPLTDSDAESRGRFLCSNRRPRRTEQKGFK